MSHTLLLVFMQHYIVGNIASRQMRVVMVCHRWLDIHSALLIPFALCTKSHSCWEDENYGRNSKQTRLQTPEGQLSPNSQLKKQHDGLDLHVTSQSAEQLRASSFKKTHVKWKVHYQAWWWGRWFEAGVMLQRDVCDMRGRAAQHLAGTRDSRFITQSTTSDTGNIMWLKI